MIKAKRKRIKKIKKKKLIKNLFYKEKRNLENI